MEQWVKFIKHLDTAITLVERISVMDRTRMSDWDSSSHEVTRTAHEPGSSVSEVYLAEQQ